MEGIMGHIISALQGMPRELAVVLISTLPVSELRGAIPWAVLVMNMPLAKVYLLAVLGNLVPVIPLLLLLNRLTEWLGRFPVFRRPLDWWFASVERRGRVVEKYGAIGLTLFVAIPLPITGAWTGCVAAMLFKKKFRYALPAIVCGVLLAGVIVSFLTWLVKAGIMENGGFFLKSITSN